MLMNIIIDEEGLMGIIQECIQQEITRIIDEYNSEGVAKLQLLGVDNSSSPTVQNSVHLVM